MGTVTYSSKSLSVLITKKIRAGPWRGMAWSGAWRVERTKKAIIIILSCSWYVNDAGKNNKNEDFTTAADRLEK